MAYAFFDVDDTLIRTKSMFAFFRFWAEDWQQDPALLRRFEEHFRLARARGVPREQLNRDYYRFLAGVELDRLEAAGRQWARGVIGEALFFPAAVAQLRARMRQAIDPVFVSGSFEPVLRPIAEHLGVRHILCTRLDVRLDNCLTGEIGRPQTIGQGKAEAIAQFLSTRRARASDCWAYGDDISDVPMLESVGHPVAVGQDAALCGKAQNMGWAQLPLTA
ncbi:HAD superfamily hydrolase (TIGR01490 family) [Rhodovulum imhoffii]|uniref:HAD superfamily hydrolase (TIGR01490 family) n=1 Tax=Rhodovulum imhoffii TaxID=365340 RepID=A0A2T5BQA7_9RHOB|nr:HAD-IB family hydrolase [Rhodovulum imhoffii]MBK5933699.1 hypothetical protein [Rhodovulum imhoffii]PTN01317.1 HAD superfamily hydrolase (TIGR01490 family) [Rhodovulum imhoffii]